MYYNRILRVWVLDPMDIFLLSALLGSIAASRLKKNLSEKKAMERLKNSIIKKSNRPISNSKEKIKRIYKLALGERGGQFENFQSDQELSKEAWMLAEEIKRLVERLASFLKERELKGYAKIFFRNGRLLLELILHKCRIDITYGLVTEGLSTQVIIITATAGGSAGFVLSWFSAGASLVAPPVLISTVLIRSVAQQIVNQRDYSKFKNLLNKIFEDEELKETLRAVFSEGQVPATTGIEMKPFPHSENKFVPDFNAQSDQTFEEFIKSRMKEELGLVENPTSEQIQEIIHTRKTKRNKGKTVYFKDFIDEIAQDPERIIDTEVVKNSIRVKVNNEEL
jgi:hypothetical protein